MRCTFHGYYRSSASYRVRIALNLKGVAYEQVGVHLVRDGGEHRSDDYRRLNPQMRVPTLVVEEPDGTRAVLTQSPAIVEWLDERIAAPPLLPADPIARAHARAIAAIVGCDIQPLVNIGPLNVLRSRFGADDVAVGEWYARWVRDGFAAIEALLGRGEGFAFGDAPGVADLYLVPQIYNARRLDVPLADFPRILAIETACAGVPAFAAAHPDRQPDAG